MIPLEMPRPSGVKTSHFTILTLGLAVLSALYIILLVVRWTGGLESGPYARQNDKNLHIRIGKTSFLVDESLMRVRSQRIIRTLTQAAGGQALDVLHLNAVWPTMAGLSEAEHAQNSTFAKNSNLVLINITADNGKELMRDRLDTVYRRLSRSADIPGPAGLKVLTLSSPVALELDQVVFEPDAKNGFIARCHRPRNKPAVCERELRMRNLVITYQFEKSLLNNWGRLDRKVQDLIDSLVLSKKQNRTGQ